MTQVTTRSRKANDIQSAAIYRCTDKASQKVFYLVASDSQSGEYHTVSFDDARACWSCSCPAMKPCKHIRAVSEVVKIRYEREQQSHEAAQIAPAVLAEMVAHDDVQAHVEDSIRSGEFVNPFAGMSKDEQREAYRALYPDDFGFAA